MASKVNGIIEKINSEGTSHAIASTAYGVCNTIANQQIKQVDMTGFVLDEGVTIHIKFTNANLASDPKLKFNEESDEDAIPIVQYGTTAIGPNDSVDSWKAGAVLSLTYDNNNWVRDFSYNSIPETQLLYYGTCSTAADTREKVVSIPAITTLTAGVSIRVLFTNAQTYNGNPQINLNNTGAKDICRVSETNAAGYEWQAGELLDFTYNGTYWILTDGALATTTYIGQTKLLTSATDTSETLSLTPASLYNFNTNMISNAPLYSSSQTYNIGDRIRYNYNTWECNTVISTAEAWTAAHWTALNPLQTQIDDLGNSSITIAGNNVKLGDNLAASTLIQSLGLSSALRFIGITTTDMAAHNNAHDDSVSTYTGIPQGIIDYTTPQIGDVVINNTYNDEWVCIGVNNTIYTWERLGSDTSYKIVQSQIAAPTATTNQWVSSIGQNANGVISTSYSSLDTSGTWSGTATTATNLANNPSIQTSNNTQVTITAGGKTSNAYTVPYATVTTGANITSTAYGIAHYSDTSGTFASTTAGEEGDVFIGKETAQGAVTTPTWYKGLNLLGTSATDWTATFGGSIFVDKTITIASKVTLQWNATDQSLDFIFI